MRMMVEEMLMFGLLRYDFHTVCVLFGIVQFGASCSVGW
jgi:hypothetical protein